MLPNKPRGVSRVDDRRVLNGIMWVLRSGARWRDLPERYRPYTTCYNCFNGWRKKGIWDRLLQSDRVTFQAGYLFEPWDVEGDAVALAHVLHDWDDVSTLRLLDRARRALPPGGGGYS